ncbi:hypothetical protein JCM8547_002848 [Rhodosporidiobolus lusitaniae]
MSSPSPNRSTPPSPPARARPPHSSLLRPRRVCLAVLAALVPAFLVQNYHSDKLVGGIRPPREADDGRESRLKLEEGEGVFPPLDELKDRDRLWPPDLNKPICTPKIYVYDLPPHLRLPEKTVLQCRWSAYNSDLLLHKLLTELPSTSHPVPPDHPHLSLYTSDPSEADFFFIPLFPACYLFDCWVKAGWTKTERCNVDEGYIQPVMEHIRTSFPFWNASGGADHLLVHPMDYVDGYYTEQSRAAMNASTYFVTVGDVRPAPYGQHFRFHRDLVIPSSTHLLNSYYVNPQDYVDEEAYPLPEPRGAAHPHRKVDLPPSGPEIFFPSPTPPLRGYFFRLQSLIHGTFPFLPSSPLKRDKRTTLAIFRGGMGTPTDGEAYSLSIRSLFFPSPSGNSSLPPYSSSVHPGFSSLPDFDIAEWSENMDYAHRLSRSKFGLVPPGYTLDTTRLYEYLAFGVVPVFIGTGPIAGQVMPFEQDVDWSSFTISIPRTRTHETPRVLREVGEEEYERLRRKGWEVGRKVVLEGREGNVWKLLARQLCRMKRIGVGPGAEIANN